ncbi:hypothetical protein FA10DRAFT_266209 [Acaromyces ingoldii]|uniref:Uncharacterized protein n=1 Tax=Acaromyces ingoldii TaxID=215250 RepID=A0A316YT29_9BASI|nr:hypothetical protein FA10DRAFT_266209 [Acaromyces ingoldii]PWN92449.1 hypothetical protein FA10DRAFT_266209 [Acaromyces ingoldii]
MGEAKRAAAMAGLEAGAVASTSASPQPQQQQQQHRRHNALFGWSIHQSYGQATLLFYVPRWTRRDDMQVTIETDCGSMHDPTADEIARVIAS